MIADVKLRPEAEALVTKYASKDTTTPSVDFHKTDISDWGQIASLWKKTLETFGRIDIVVNGAGVYEPPSSTFWNAPGISPLAEDEANASPGVYHTFSVNTMGPIRLAQIAIDYWLENRNIEGNLLWIASLGGYVHSLQTPLYFSSKAASASFVRSLGQLRKRLGIRNAAVCPGAVYVRLSSLDSFLHCFLPWLHRESRVTWCLMAFVGLFANEASLPTSRHQSSTRNTAAIGCTLMT